MAAGNPARRSRERCKLPQQGLGRSAGAQAEIEFGALSLKIWHEMATIIKIFLRID